MHPDSKQALWLLLSNKYNPPTHPPLFAAGNDIGIIETTGQTISPGYIVKWHFMFENFLKMFSSAADSLQICTDTNSEVTQPESALIILITIGNGVAVII